MPAKWKFGEVEELAKRLNESPVVAVAGIEGIPSRQMQEIRKKLHGSVEIRVIKNRLARLAFEKINRTGLKKLEDYITGPTALIFSKENPFRLAKMFLESRVKAPAKEGQEAPEDIIVPAGDTPFKPGPIIGDLQEVGIKAKIQGPIIAIIQDSPVIKKGEKFSKKLAGVLTQLGIFPMEIGIDVRAAFEDGIIYGEDILSIDTEKVLSDIAVAYQHALNLSVEAGIFNKVSLPLLLTNAAGAARNLAIGAEIYNEETVDYFLSKAHQEAKSLTVSVSYEPRAKPAPEEKKENRAGESTEGSKDEAGDRASEEVETTKAAQEISGESSAKAKKEDQEAARELSGESAKKEAAGNDAGTGEEQNAETPAEDGGTQDISPETEARLVKEADPLEQVPEVGGDGAPEESKESESQNK